MYDKGIFSVGFRSKKLLEKRFEPIMKKYGLRNIELEILIFLSCARYGDTATDIINVKHLSKAHISKSVNNLCIKGYVKLIEDEKDHRLIHLKITEKADELVEKAERVKEECIESIWKDIPKDKRNIVEETTLILAENIQKELMKFSG